MVRGQSVCLDTEQILRISQMGLQVRRKLVEGPEQTGESPLIGTKHGVVRVAHIKTDRSMVGIDGYLHRIANIVETPFVRIGRGIAHGSGVTINDPEEPAFTHHHIGVRIKGDERRNAAHPLSYLPMELYPALGLDIA